MGYVYAGQGTIKRQFKIGYTAADPERRLAQHRTSNPGFVFYRVLQTKHHYAAEQFLKAYFAQRRLANTTEWFAVDREEVDTGFIALAEFMKTHLSVTQERTVKDLARQKTDGVLVEPNSNYKEICKRLRSLKSEIDLAKLEFDNLAAQLKYQIGIHEGIEGLISWECKTMQRIDQDMLKTRFPEIWEQCRKELRVRYFRLLNEADLTGGTELQPQLDRISISDLLQSDELLLSVRFHSARRT